MDWHSILETAFLVMFWLGLALTILMALMSGAFHQEIGAGSSFEGGVAQDLGGAGPDAASAASLHPGEAEVGWSEGDIPGFSPWSPTVICAALTGAGGLGYICLARWNMGPAGSALFAVVGGLFLGGLTFATVAWAFKKFQSSSHVSAASLVGVRARVSTSIEPGRAGAIAVEAAGSRMVMPARCADAAAVPEGAEVEIVRVDGAIYEVKETRESWLARSKSGAR